MRKILVLATLLFISIFWVNAAYADYLAAKGGVPVPVGQLVINKQVSHPQSGYFLENLAATDIHFLPDQEILFRIEVRNIGTAELTGLTIRDQLPEQLKFVSGPGSFDANSKSLNFRIERLKPQESQVFELKARVQPLKLLPSTPLICPTNLLEVKTGQLFGQDTVSFCIETRVLGATQQLPITGPKDTMIVLIFSFVSLALSLAFFLREKLRYPHNH